LEALPRGTGRPELEPQTEGHHCGPDPAAVASAATATNLPPARITGSGRPSGECPRKAEVT
jgi:hypothetical protein